MINLKNISSDTLSHAIREHIVIKTPQKKQDNSYQKITAKARIYSQKFGIPYDDVKLILFELDSEKRMSL